MHLATELIVAQGQPINGFEIAQKACKGFDLPLLSLEVGSSLDAVAVESFHREKLREQHLARHGRAPMQGGMGGGGGGGGGGMMSAEEAGVLRMQKQRLAALEAEVKSTRASADKLKEKLKKAHWAEKEATQLASKVLAPLETLHEELSAKVRDSPQEQARLGAVLTQARTLLEKHKYAFDWQAEIQKAAQAQASETVDIWDTVHKPTPVSAFLGTTCALGGLTLAQRGLRAWDLSLAFGLSTSNEVLFIGAFGALSALLYGAPAAPLGRPKATAQGFALVNILCLAVHFASRLCEHYTGYGLTMEMEQILLPAFGIGAMIYFKLAMHPPAAACAISYAQASAKQQWYTYLIGPALLGVCYMLFVQWCIARAVHYLNRLPAAPVAPAAADDAKSKATASSGGADGGAPAGVDKAQKSRRACFASNFAVSRASSRRNRQRVASTASSDNDSDGASSIGSTCSVPNSARHAPSSSSNDASRATSPMPDALAPAPARPGAASGGSSAWGRVRMAKPTELV